MAIIGTFTKTDEAFVGTIRTLTINAKSKIMPVKNKKSESSPDYRIVAAGADLGCGWMEESKEDGKPYISVKLDDPSLPKRRRGDWYNGLEPCAVVASPIPTTSPALRPGFFLFRTELRRQILKFCLPPRSRDGSLGACIARLFEVANDQEDRRSPVDLRLWRFRLTRTYAEGRVIVHHRDPQPS